VRAALPLFRRQRLVQLFVTNVRGPRTRLALGGASLLRAYPVAPLNGNVTLGVAVLSYADMLGVGIVAERVSVPDLDVVVAGIQDAAAELPSALLGGEVERARRWGEKLASAAAATGRGVSKA
jgi:diacylglycerol O-acyltransferase